MKEQSLSYQQGYKAGLENVSNDKNPYNEGTNEWKDWLDGYARGVEIKELINH